MPQMKALPLHLGASPLLVAGFVCRTPYCRWAMYALLSRLLRQAYGSVVWRSWGSSAHQRTAFTTTRATERPMTAAGPPRLPPRAKGVSCLQWSPVGRERSQPGQLLASPRRAGPSISHFDSHTKSCPLIRATAGLRNDLRSRLDRTAAHSSVLLQSSDEMRERTARISQEADCTA
jgi:hypothetical protein